MTASRTSSIPVPCLALISSASLGLEGQGVFDLLLGGLDLGAGQINLVDDRDDGQLVVHGQLGVGERLGFDALRGVNHQQRAFTRREAARDLVGEIDVPRRVDEVQLVLRCRRGRGNAAARRGP